MEMRNQDSGTGSNLGGSSDTGAMLEEEATALTMDGKLTACGGCSTSQEVTGWWLLGLIGLFCRRAGTETQPR